MSMIDPSKSKSRFLLGLFLICMCVLMTQIIETRILSVISWYYLAFLSISMAMFGMTAGSLFVYFKEQWFPAERFFENLAWISSAFAIAVEVSALLLISTVLMTGGKPEFLMVVLFWFKLIVVLAAPYVFAGMAISLALTRSPWPIPLVYGVDLTGAAIGCLVVLVVLTFVEFGFGFAFSRGYRGLGGGFVFIGMPCIGLPEEAAPASGPAPNLYSALDPRCVLRPARIRQRRDPALRAQALDRKESA